MACSSDMKSWKVWGFRKGEGSQRTGKAGSPGSALGTGVGVGEGGGGKDAGGGRGDGGGGALGLWVGRGGGGGGWLSGGAGLGPSRPETSAS